MYKFFLLFVILFISVCSNFSKAQSQTESLLSRATLYSHSGHPDKNVNDCFSFEERNASNCEDGINEKWDLRYGGLRLGDDWDWFDVSGGFARTRISYVGKFAWTDSFEVPVIEPFPKLKEGEQRIVTISANGNKGVDGKPSERGANGVNEDGTITPSPNENAVSFEVSETKVEKKPKVDGRFAEAVVGNMYAIRVVDENLDFYVLFRVESLVRGDNCTISWKRIPSPESKVK